MKTCGTRGAIGAAVAALALVACDGLLEVSDPNRLTSEDVDQSLAALANGIEGAAYEPVDEWVVFQALLADVYQSTDTAEATKAIDQGDISNSSWISGIANEWSRAKGAGRNAEERFRRVLGEAEAESSALTAQVRLAVGLVGLYEGMTFCWSVSNGDVLTDREVLRRGGERLYKSDRRGAVGWQARLRNGGAGGPGAGSSAAVGMGGRGIGCRGDSGGVFT